MGTIVIGSMELGTLLIGGLLGKILPKITQEAKTSLTAEESAAVKDAMKTLRDAAAKLVAELDARL